MPLKQLGDCDSLSQEKLNGIDLLLVIGNDETIFKVAVLAAKNGITMLGVNARECYYTKELLALGFHEAENLPCYLEGKLHIEDCALLRVKMAGGDEYEDVLSDAIIRARSDSEFIRIKLNSNGGQPMLCAGLLVTTHTGSAIYANSIDPTNYPCLAHPRKGTYPYGYKRLQSFETREFMGGVAVESDFKLTASVSDDNGQATLEVDGRPSKLKWNKTRTVEFCASPNGVKLLRRKTPQQ